MMPNPPEDFGAQNRTPVHKRVPRTDHLTITTVPNEDVNNLFNIGACPLGNGGGRHMEGGRRGEDCFGKCDSSSLGDAPALPSRQSTMNLVDEQLIMNLP